MGKQIVYDSMDLSNASEEILKDIDKALLAAAFKIRDEMRSYFVQSKGQYKHSTSNYNHLDEGIMVGKLNNNTVKIHALGNNQKNSDLFKTRFFVGGTKYRTQVQKNGKPIKSFSKGYIESNDAVDKGKSNAQNILNNFINNTLNK